MKRNFVNFLLVALILLGIGLNLSYTPKAHAMLPVPNMEMIYEVARSCCTQLWACCRYSYCELPDSTNSEMFSQIEYEEACARNCFDSNIALCQAMGWH